MVNASLFILSPQIIKYIPENHKSDFEKDVFPVCLADGLKMCGYVSFEYIKDMGTPDRYESVCRDVGSGRVCRSNRKNKQPAVFLDRDGVINREVNLLSNASQLELIPGAADAIRLINKAGYLAIVVTNQPVIARNLCSIDELNLIHDTLETKLGKEGAYLNAIYYCPHHPDGGYPEERKEYKMICECRKPKPGLLLKAADEWNIDLKASYVIGDKKSDVEAGMNAGVKQNILIEQNKEYALLKVVKDIFGCN
jgi:D,D-heptose 1,7-bisphosphate phosphatase